MTTWELHKRGSSTWVTAECPICKNGCVIDTGEIFAFIKSLIIDLPDGTSRLIPDYEDRVPRDLWGRITFNHCRIREPIPGQDTRPTRETV
jgi:hypothetical protein